MQIQRIQHLIEHPDEVMIEDREGLEQWSREYPYAGVFAMLLARCSAVEGHMNEEKDLLRAASTMSFRQPLFDLIVQAKLVEEARAVHDSLTEAESPSSEIAQVADVSDHGAVGKQGLNPNEPVEREALISAIERSIEKDVNQWEGDSAASQGTISAAEPADIQLIQGAVSSPFSNWLLQRASEVGFGESPSAVALNPDSDAHSRLNPSDKKMTLIDRFIASKPSIGPIRDPQEERPWASESIMEDPSLVTETMARVYAKQGLFDKARKAYHVLALKYPAKSTYFALQLKKLDDPDANLGSSNE